MLCLLPLATTCVASAADRLAYHFTGDKQPVYEVKIRAEYPTDVRSHTLLIAYDIRSVDAVNGQVRFTFNSAVSSVTTKTDAAPAEPPLPSTAGLFNFNRQGAPEIVMDRFGKVARASDNSTEPQTPVLGWPIWCLMLQPLSPDGDKSWVLERDIAVYSNPARGQRGAQDGQTSSMHEIVTFTTGAAEGGLVPITRKYEVESAEKVGSLPVSQHRGEGTIIFNSTSGLVQAMEQKLLIQWNQKNVTMKIPVTASARLLSAEEIAPLKAQATEAEAKRKEAHEKFVAGIEAKRRAQTAPLPGKDETAAQLKKISTTWQKSDAAAIDLLPKMLGQGAIKPSDDGTVLLTRGQTIITPNKIKVPATFRVVALTRTNDLRFAHAADQLIFNWEMRPDELRLDGALVRGKHKDGAGALPPAQWTGIEWVVRANEMIIYVDGEERHRIPADFSKVDKPFSIRSHQGETLIHSVELLQ